MILAIFCRDILLSLIITHMHSGKQRTTNERSNVILSISISYKLS